MTVAEILEQARKLTSQERDELLEKLQVMQSSPIQKHSPKTGAEIVAMLKALDEPVEMVDPHIEDPVEWVKTQRRKRQEKLKPYRDQDT